MPPILSSRHLGLPIWKDLRNIFFEANKTNLEAFQDKTHSNLGFLLFLGRPHCPMILYFTGLGTSRNQRKDLISTLELRGIEPVERLSALQLQGFKCIESP